MASYAGGGATMIESGKLPSAMARSLVIAAFAAACLCAQAPRAPRSTAEEQAVVREITKIRRFPREYARYLRALGTRFEGTLWRLEDHIPIRTEEGRQIRSAFIADDGCLLLSADYSQVELRVLASSWSSTTACRTGATARTSSTRISRPPARPSASTRTTAP